MNEDKLTPEEKTALKDVTKWGQTKFKGRDPANQDQMLTEVCLSIHAMNKMLYTALEALNDEIEILNEKVDVLNEDQRKLKREQKPNDSNSS